MNSAPTISQIDDIMQIYIDSGQYSKEELAEIRKREANKLKETTRETSWWRGEEGWIPDELQPGVSRPRVSKEVEDETDKKIDLKSLMGNVGAMYATGSAASVGLDSSKIIDKKTEDDSISNKYKDEINDELLEVFTIDDLFLDENKINRGKFAHKGDKAQGIFEIVTDEHGNELVPYTAPVGGRSYAETGGRTTKSATAVDYETGLDLFTFGMYSGQEMGYDVDMSGGVTLKDGTIVSYEYIWDHKEELKQHALKKAGVSLTEEKVAKFGSEEELNKYIADNAWVYFKEDEQEYYQLKGQLEKIKSGELDGDVDEINSRIEAIAEEKGWEILYDENGSFIDIKKPDPEPGSEGEGVEADAQQLADDYDLKNLERMRQQSAIRLENLAYIAHENIDEIGEEMAWYEDIGGFFDFSEDSYDNDKENLSQVVQARDLFGSDNILTNLPGGADIKTAFNKELLNFRTLSRALDLNINVAMIPEENELTEIIDNLGETLFGDKLFGTEEDDARDAFEQVLENDGYDVDVLGEHIEFGWRDVIQPLRKRKTREMIWGVGTDLAPLLLELYAFKKVGGLKKIESAVTKLATKLTPKSTPKILKNVIDRLVVPGVITTSEWTAAELGGQAIMGGGGGWQAHTINTTTGETNFTMPMVMGMSGGVWRMLSGTMASKFAENSLGKAILPKLTNPRGWLHGTRKVGGKMLGQGFSGSAMLMIAETAQANIDSLLKEGKIAEAERWGEIWNIEHFATTAWALTMLSAQKVAPEARAAFARDIAHLKGSTVESKNAAKYYKIKEKSEKEEVDEALKSKLKEIENDDSLNKKEKAKETEVATIHAKHLHVFREVLALKARYKKKFGKKGYGEYLQDIWNQSQISKKDITNLTEAEYDLMSKLEPWEIEDLAIRNGLDLNSESFKTLQSAHDVVRGLVEVANALDASRAKELVKGREDYFRNTLKTMVNKNRIEVIKKKVKEGKSSSKDEIELKELKETNDFLFEKNEAYFNKYQAKWNKVLRARVNAAKVLAANLGGRLKQMRTSDWKKRGLDPDSDAAYVDGVLYLNMEVIRKTRNLGAPIHEVVHHILRNSLKGKDGNITKEGIEIIDELVNKFTLREQVDIQKRIDDNYKYEDFKSREEYESREIDPKEVKEVKENADGSITIEYKKETYYEEYITSISDGIVNGQIKYNTRTMRKVGKIAYPWLKGFMPNLYRYNINGTRSSKAARDLFDMLGDVSAVNKVRAETIEGLKGVAGEGPGVRGKVVKSKTESPLEAINNLIPKKIKTKKDYDALIQNERTAKPIIDALNKPGGVINNYIRSRQTSQIEGNKIIEEAVFRLFNFNPEAKRADGTPVGKEGFGEFIFANTRFAKLVAREALFEEGERRKREKGLEDVKDLGAPTPKAPLIEFDGRSIKIAPRLGPKALKIHNKVMDMVKFISEGKLPYMVKLDLSHIDLTKATFKSLKGVALKEIQRMFGVDPKTGNLSKTDVKNAQMFINQHPDLFIAMLPIHHTTKMVNIGTKKAEIWESRPDKATGIQQVLLDAFYRKGTRKDNLTPWYKKENIRTADFLKVFGIMERGKPNTYKKESNTSARIHALMKQVERMIVNQAVREKLIADGNGLEALASHIAEGKSEAMYSKSVFRNKDVSESTQFEFDRKKRSFHLEIARQGLSKKAIRRAYDIIFPEGNFTDVLLFDLRTNIINDYIAMLKPYVAKLESYKEVEEKFPEKIEEFLARVDLPSANLAVRDYMGLKKPMGDYFADPIQKRKGGQFSTDIRSTIINKNLEGVTGTKEIQSIKDQGIVDAIRHKSHLENGDNSPKRAMVFYLKDGFIKDHLSKIPGYENLVDYRKKKATDTKTKEVKRWVELEFKDGTIRKIELPESSKFDGEQRTTQDMIDGKVSEAERVLRKEAADYHWERTMETFENAVELADGKTYGNVELGMLLAGFLGNMKTSLRAAAEFRYSPVNPPTRKLFERVWNAKKGEYVNKKLWEYEHGIPAKAIALILADHFFRGNKVDLKKLQESYSVGVIHRDFNKNFGEVFKERMQYTYQIGNIPPARWFNTWTAMGEAHAVRDIYTDVVYGEVQVNYWNKVKANHKKLIQQDNKIIKQVVSKAYSKSSKKETIKDLRIIDKAINLGRTPKEKKGMSAWDFDDTLARTKSGVRYTLPNPSGKPAPQKKVIFMAGGPGAGKSNVIKQLGLEKQGFKIVNQDISLQWLAKNHGLPTDMRDFTSEQASKWSSLGWKARTIAKHKQMKFQGKGDGIIVDGTGASLKMMEQQVKEFRDKGYDVQMMFVETSKEVAIERNRIRKERSLRTSIVEKTWDSVMKNKEAFKELFGERFADVNTDKLKQNDPMPTKLVSKLDDFTKGYIKGRLDPGEYANKGTELETQGAKFDFAEFDIVKEGEKGPLFGEAMKRAKKFGLKDQFVITARPHAAKMAIFRFLDAQGLKIPFDNIITLESSSAEAKAMFMLEKFSEGYNDMYFADDALRNVEIVKSVLDQLKVKSKVVLAKAQKEKLLNNVKDVDKLGSPENYDNIKYSKSHRAEYEKTISKFRPDLVKDGLVSKTIDNMFIFIDSLNIPNNKKRKYEQITTKWLATSSVKLVEDRFKITDAINLAERYKEDVFSYRNPNELIEKYAGKVKKKFVNPNNVKEFGSSGNYKERGITIYNVENTKKGQQAVRDIINSHWGENSNPWCLTQAKNGKITEDAWLNWTAYEKGPKRIIFQDGKLSSFYANRQYWDRMDNATDGPTITIKKGSVTKKTELVEMDDGKIEEFVRETRTVSADKKTVTTEIFADSQDGYAEGTKIVENRVNGITVKSTRYSPDGKLVEIKEFSEGGKATASYSFFPNGRMSAVNTYGQPFGDMSVNDVVMKKGDILSHQIEEGNIAYMYGKINLDAQGIARDRYTPPVAEVGWKMPVNESSLKNVIQTIDGKVRINLKKVLEIDPDTKGLPRKAAGMRAIEPVKKVLDQLDINSDVQQAIRYSKTRSKISKNFNQIIEESFGVETKKSYSEGKGRIVGKDKGKWKFFGTPGAEDLAGLVTYAFAGKGKQGEAHKKFFEDHLHKPFNRAYNDIHARKQNISNDYKALRKQVPNVRKRLNDKVDGIYTVDQAIRVHLWDLAGFEIPGLTKTSLRKLTEFVRTDAELVLFADQLSKITMLTEGYLKPKEYWLGENITSDMNNVVERVYRKEALAEFIENRKAIFGEWQGGRIVGENMNKIESLLGPKHREALENMLWRMENGTNRMVGTDSNTNRWMNWVNNSVGAIMFFNQKSAALQTISSLNYINGNFNNPFAAARAFANLPQYCKDFMTIMNSDMLVQRRAGLRINVEAAELVERVGSGEGGPQKALAWLLQKGFIPTKYADSFAISAGGATYYRNAIRKYKKQGLSEKEAEKKAWEDFTEITEATQQSSRPDLISMQQASGLGRPILAFANTPMQMFRRHKRRIQDIANNRGNMKENILSAVYYGAVQTIIFSYLANAMFAVDDESDDPNDIAFHDKKKDRHIQTILDSYLRGMGTGGAGVAALKNGIVRFAHENKKGYNADYGNVVIDMLNVSPPIGSKARKLHSAGKTWGYNKEIIPEMGLSLDNPAVLAVANVISATTNIPIDRVVMKAQNLKDASNSDFETWQRIAMFMGLNKWTLGIEDEELEARKDAIEKRVKKTKKREKVNYLEIQKQERKEGKKDIKCADVSKSGNRCRNIAESGSSYCTIHARVTQRVSGKKTQCKGKRTNGQRCKMQTSNKSGYCYYHD